MAQQEHPREDLLREATALIDRIELTLPGDDESIVIGFRRDGAASIFWGQDEVYQFRADYSLRRGFWHGRLLKAESGQLIELTRQRTADTTFLRRRVLPSSEQIDFMRKLCQRLDRLRTFLTGNATTVVGSISATGTDVRQRVRQWLEQLPADMHIAHSPHVAWAKAHAPKEPRAK
jgi:hypothetical protein